MTRPELIKYLRTNWDVSEDLPGLSRKSLKELQELKSRLAYLRQIKREQEEREREALAYSYFVQKRL